MAAGHDWIGVAILVVVCAIVIVPRWRSPLGPALAVATMGGFLLLAVCGLIVFDHGPDVSAWDALVFVVIFFLAPVGGVLLAIRWWNRRRHPDRGLR
jgi:hypothetical protein